MTVTSEIQKTRIWYKFNVISQAIEKKKNRRKIDQKSPTANFPIQQCKRSILGSTSFKVFTIEWHFEWLIEAYFVKESPPPEFSIATEKETRPIASCTITTRFFSVFVPPQRRNYYKGHFDTKAPFSLTFLLYRSTSRVVHHDASNIGGNTRHALRIRSFRECIIIITRKKDLF